VAGQFLYQNFSISIEHIHKILQHFEVESWSKQLAVGCPTLPCRTAIQTACVQTRTANGRTQIYNKIYTVSLTSLLGQLFRLTTTNQTIAT
jgi:hypothetical protein